MRNSIKVKTIINILNIIVFLSYIGGLYFLRYTKIAFVYEFINLLLYATMLYSTYYFVSRIKVKRYRIIKNNYLIFIFIFTVLIITMFTNKLNLLAMRETIFLIGTGFYSIYLSDYYNLDEIIKLLFISEFGIVIFTIVFTILYPQYGKAFYDSQMVWVGAFSHKNILGGNMVFSIIISLLCYDRKKNISSNLIVILNLSLSLMVILLCNSKTSLFIVICIILFCYLYKVSKIKINPIFILVFVYPIVYFLATNEYEYKYNDMFLRYFNRDLTFTGRAAIWKAAINIIKEKLFFGYGLIPDFWNDDSLVGQYLRNYAGFNASHTHNGILEWITRIGIVGTSILIIMLVITQYKLKKINYINIKLSMFSTMYILFLLSFYVTESDVNPRNYIILILFIIIEYVNKECRNLSH